MMEPYTVMGERAYTVLHFWEAVVDRNPFRILDELQNHMSQTITALFSFSFFSILTYCTDFLILLPVHENQSSLHSNEAASQICYVHYVHVHVHYFQYMLVSAYRQR